MDFETLLGFIKNTGCQKWSTWDYELRKLGWEVRSMHMSSIDDDSLYTLPRKKFHIIWVVDRGMDRFSIEISNDGFYQNQILCKMYKFLRDEPKVLIRQETIKFSNG